MEPLWRRHNNPGDVSLPIEGWHGPGHVVGAHGQPGYAEFPSMPVGMAAFRQRLVNYITAKGYHTLGLIARHYATDPHWGIAVSHLSGLGLGEELNSGDAVQMAHLEYGILAQEIGAKNAHDVLRGMI